jgi:hypothetical protein
MRGGSGNAFGGPRLLLPKDNHPETFDIDLSASAQNRTFAQIATCSTLAAGAGLMAMPLGPAGVTGAATVSSHLCDMAFERSRR